MIIKMMEVVSHINMFLILIVKIIGRIITISISKIRNSTAIRKNWEEKGIRDDLFGSKPHSKGDIFSRSIIVFFLIIVHNIIKIIEIEVAKIMAIIILIITFSYEDLLIGSQK